MKSVTLNLLELSGPLLACNGIALPLLFTFYIPVLLGAANCGLQ